MENIGDTSVWDCGTWLSLDPNAANTGRFVYYTFHTRVLAIQYGSRTTETGWWFEPI